jgi:hypothetical protein
MKKFTRWDHIFGFLRIEKNNVKGKIRKSLVLTLVEIAIPWGDAEDGIRETEFTE